jgi:prepilin-type N-terminal cleavage/methylation domain-containing protein
MRRSGFTMIELVFVIVILGILASVAIPKLAATRDDANIAKASTEISSFVSDIGSYYTAHGHFDGNISKMTNVPVTQTAMDFNTSAPTPVTYDDKQRGLACIDITGNDSNGTLTLKANDGNKNTPFCKGLDKAVAKLLVTHTFGGSAIY